MAYDPLCALADVKQWLDIKPGEESQDDVLDWLVQSCSAQIGQFCGRDNLGAIGTYTENYRPRMAGPRPCIVLRHWPVTTLTKVLVNNTSLPILTAAQLQANTPGVTPGGVFLEDDGRTLSFLNLYSCPPSGIGYGYIQVAYTAGYNLSDNSIPYGLRQGAVQFVGEVFKSKSWIGYKAKSLAGETTSFEGGAAWGMSPRTKAMLQPYVNRLPGWMT